MRLHLNQDQQAEEHRRHKHLPCEYKSFPYFVVIQDQNVIASMWLEQDAENAKIEMPSVRQFADGALTELLPAPGGNLHCMLCPAGSDQAIAPMPR